ncbi:MAG: RluA family pseudouridine synthase [Bradymonadia bacterium]
MSDGPQLSVHPNPRVPLEVVYEGPHFLVVSKPSGVVTQPGVGHTRDTVLNGLFARYGKALQNLGKSRDFGLLHRLDRPTSGLLVVGLSIEGYDGLRQQFAKRTLLKEYVALVHGGPRPSKGVERTPIREIRRDGRKQAQVGEHPRAEPAETRYEIVSRARGVSLVQCRIKTGRLHQIRAHMAHRGSPVVGDREYGRRGELDRRFARSSKRAFFLHAGTLGFTDPVTGRGVQFNAPLPETHLKFLEELGVACPRRWKPR